MVTKKKFNDSPLSARIRYLVRFKTAPEGADFSDAKLGGIALENSILKGINFKRANMPHAVLCGATLESCSFEDANLFGIDMSLANCRFSDFSNAKMANSDLCESDFRLAVFTRARLDDSSALFSNFSYCLMNHARLNKINFKKCSLICANLTEASINHTCLEGSDLSGAILTNADMESSNLGRTILKGTLFEGTKLGLTILDPKTKPNYNNRSVFRSRSLVGGYYGFFDKATLNDWDCVESYPYYRVNVFSRCPHSADHPGFRIWPSKNAAKEDNASDVVEVIIDYDKIHYADGTFRTESISISNEAP